MSGGEPVTSPDHHQPMVSRRLARTGAILSIILLVLMAQWGNHEGQIENLFLYGIAAIIALMLIGDVVLRRKGLRD